MEEEVKTQESKDDPIVESLQSDLSLVIPQEVVTTNTQTNDLSLELPKEESSTTTLTTDSSLSLNEQDLGEGQMEEVRIESVDVNTTNIPVSDTKQKPSFSLEQIWLYLRNSFLYYTSCSTKNKQQTNKCPP